MVIVASRQETARAREGKRQIQAGDATNERKDILTAEAPETASEGPETAAVKKPRNRTKK